MKKIYLSLAVLCTFFTLYAEIAPKLKSLVSDEWHNYIQVKNITDTFVTYLPARIKEELKDIKVFEILKETGQFMIVLTDSDATSLYAQLKFSFRLRWDTHTQSDYQVGYIELLHVVKKDIRKSGIGSALLRYALSKKYNNIPCIELYAYPFDYTDPVERNEKLPKLLGFYMRHGGKIINQNSDSANIYFDLPNI